MKDFEDLIDDFFDSVEDAIDKASDKLDDILDKIDDPINSLLEEDNYNMLVKSSKLPIPKKLDDMPGRSVVRRGGGGSSRSGSQQNKETPIVPENIEVVKLTPLEEKRNLKNSLKKGVNKKFIVGHKYALRTKSKAGSEVVTKTFILKKFIYSVENRPINILVLKQIDGPVTNMYTINRQDCLTLHVKFENGLQVWPMDLNWRHITDKTDDNK